MSRNGTKSNDAFPQAVGKIMWEYVGMSRNEKAEKGIEDIKRVEEFWKM